MKKGRIIPNGVELKEHELKTVVFLTEQGFDVELIPISERDGIKTPDIILNGLEWEMKSPNGNGKWTIKNAVQDAMHQSENIIIDLRRIKIPQEKCIAELKKQFTFAKRLKRMKIVTKSKKLLEYQK